MIKLLLILLCFTLTECRFIYPYSYYYYGNYHNLRHFRRYYSINKPSPYFDPFQNNQIIEFQCPDEKLRCSYPFNYRDTYIFQCYCDDDCPENYKCCPDSCFQHKVCKEIETKRSTVIRMTTTPFQTTEIITETERITESEKITEGTTTSDNESTNATLTTENTTLTEREQDETTVKRTETETTTEKQPAPETTQIIEANGSGDDDDEDVTEAQVPAEIRLTATVTPEISGNSDDIEFDDSTDNNRNKTETTGNNDKTIKRKEANIDDDDDEDDGIGDSGSGVAINEENLPQVPQIKHELHEEKEEAKNRSVSTEDLQKGHEETEGNRKNSDDIEFDDSTDNNRIISMNKIDETTTINKTTEHDNSDNSRNKTETTGYIHDDDEDVDIGDIGSGVAVNEENLPQVPQTKHELNEEKANNGSVSTEDLQKEHEEPEGNRKEDAEVNEADLEDYFLPDYESETSGNSDDSTDNNRTISMNKIDETTINKTTDNSDYKNKTEMTTRQQSIIRQNDNVINQKQAKFDNDDEDIGDIGSGDVVNEENLQVPQIKHELDGEIDEEEETKNRFVSFEDLPKGHDETERNRKEDDEKNEVFLEDHDINRKKGEIADIGSGNAVNEENPLQIPQIKHELHREEEAKNRSVTVGTEGLPKEHEEIEENGKEDAIVNEADLEAYNINRKEGKIDDDDDDEDTDDIGTVNEENLPQVPQIKHELHGEEEVKNRSVSTEDLPKEPEEIEGNRKEANGENEDTFEDYVINRKEANTGDVDDDNDDDIGDIGSSGTVNEENLPQIPQINHELHGEEEEEAKNRPVSTEVLPKKHKETEKNRKEDDEENEADLEDYVNNRKEANIDDDEDIGSTAVNEENLSQVPKIKHELHEKEAKNGSESTEVLPKEHEEMETNKKENAEENEADLEVYFLPDNKSERSGNSDDSTDNIRATSMNKIDETEMITQQSITEQNYNVINQKRTKIDNDDDEDIGGDIGSGDTVNEENLPQVPQVKHKLHGKEEAKNRPVTTEDLPKKLEETEKNGKENEATLEDYVINRKQANIDDDDDDDSDEDIGDMGSGGTVNEENLPQVSQIRHELNEEKETKKRFVDTEDLPKEHEETEGNRKEDDEVNEADWEDYFLPDYEILD